MKEVEHFLETQNKLGEGPIWSPNEQSLYWLDIHQKFVQRYDSKTKEVKKIPINLVITVLGLRSKGGFVFASDRGFGLWGGLNREPMLLTDPEADKPHNRFNDGAVDPSGRFWAGSMYEGPETDDPTEGRLYRMNLDHSIDLMETGLTICNGMGWSPDLKTMYLTDTLRRIIYTYDYDLSNGEVENRQVFIKIDETDGFPDGMTVDKDGFIWSAIWGGWKICRFDPEGKLERSVQLPVECPTSVTFGGKYLNELYITSAWTILSEQQRKDQPQAGDVFRLHLDIGGFEESKFLG